MTEKKWQQQDWQGGTATKIEPVRLRLNKFYLCQHGVET